MTTDALSNLAEWEWLCSAEGRSLLDSFADQFNNEPETQLLRAARAALPRTRASLVVEQIRLRQRAAKKFRQPEKWIWTPLLLEQATDEYTAQFVAGFYPANHSVVDLCCGAGSDAVALARDNRTLAAVDSCPIAVCITKSNLDAHGLAGTVNCGLAENFSIPKNAWVQCDPDRRPTGKRVTNLESLCPSQPALENIIRQSSGGSIKLAPATEPPEAWRSAYGLQWISSERCVRQLRIWWGAEAFGPGTRSASIRDHQGVWHTLQRTAQAYDRSRSTVRYTDACEAWIGDYDPAVRTAELTCCLAEEVQASIIETDTGYLTASKPQTHAMVTWFCVVDVLSADMKKLRAYFRQNNVGVLEIKQRGTGFDLEKLRRELKLQGEAKRTLFYFRAKGAVRAVIAERIPSPP
jgi:THUMP domain-like